jgi:hypothetical protein
MVATVIPYSVFLAAGLKRKRRTMFNTKFLNIHDIIVIGAIAIIVHILVFPMLAKIGVNPPSASENAG